MSEASYLDIYLAPLAAFLNQADVTDLYVNQPEELWVERQGGLPERYVVPELTERLLWRLAKQIANISHQGISREHPLLAARLPDGARVQIIGPPATRGSMALAIRKHLTTDMTLDDYAAAGAFASTRPDSGAAADEPRLCEAYRVKDWTNFLRLAVRARKTILVSGGTSTGKTTFLNAMLREVLADERVIVIEDTPEIQVPLPNMIGLVAVRGELGETRVTSEDLLTATLRMRPDRIIVGELRGSEALTFLRAANTGHPGSMSTIHADTPRGAFEQLAILSRQERNALSRAEILDYARSVVDIVVQLERNGGGRRVAGIHWSMMQK